MIFLAAKEGPEIPKPFEQRRDRDQLIIPAGQVGPGARPFLEREIAVLEERLLPAVAALGDVVGKV